MTMPLFANNVTRQTVEKQIEQSKALLNDVTAQNKEFFLFLLDQRIEDFTRILEDKTQSDLEKEQVLMQYNRFAKTLLNCFKRPNYSSLYLSVYHNQMYYPVGITNESKPEPLTYYGSRIGTLFGAGLILAALAAFAFNPLIGLILLPMGITLLAPSLYLSWAPNLLDSTEKKIEEQIIFAEGLKLLAPEVVVDEIDEAQNSLYAPMI